jgi:hypothetical protein
MYLMNRKAVALTAILALTLVGPMSARSAVPSPVDLTTDVRGEGFWSALTCMGCAGGAIAIASSGVGAVLVAIAVEGSTLVVAGCVGACIAAFQ